LLGVGDPADFDDGLVQGDAAGELVGAGRLEVVDW
jgi:hypothetical protein